MTTLMEILAILGFCGVPMVVTGLATARHCRDLSARNEHASYGTMLLGACSTPLLLVLLGAGEWSARESSLTSEVLIRMLCYVAVMCILSALGVLLYYEEGRSGTLHS